MKKLISATVLMRCLSEGFCITEKNKLINCLKLLNSIRNLFASLSSVLQFKKLVDSDQEVDSEIKVD